MLNWVLTGPDPAGSCIQNAYGVTHLRMSREQGTLVAAAAGAAAGAAFAAGGATAAGVAAAGASLAASAAGAAGATALGSASN